MKVIHTYPQTGEQVVLMDEQRYPNGPLSPSVEHQIEFLEWNTEKMREMIKKMPANENRQAAIAERDRQVAVLGNMKKKQKDMMLRQLNRIDFTRKNPSDKK